MVWDRELKDWVDPGPRVRGESLFPAIWSDCPAYRSPLGTGVIDGRAARREDLKRGGCREVDPSEFRPVCHSEKLAKKYGLPHEPAIKEARKIALEPEPVFD